MWNAHWIWWTSGRLGEVTGESGIRGRADGSRQAGSGGRRPQPSPWEAANAVSARPLPTLAAVVPEGRGVRGDGEAAETPGGAVMLRVAARCVAVLVALGVLGQGTNSAAILAQSADLRCLEYQAVGGCLWLRCRGVPSSCSTVTSIKYRHYVPDAVVTAYSAAGQNPWTELGSIVSLVPGSDGGTLARGASTRASTGLRFKQAEVVGSPGIAWVQALNLGTTICEPGPTAMVPYYVSSLDPVWRTDTLQAPATLVNLLRKVPASGLTGPTWGPVYPRGGFVEQLHDYKAAAVVAQRAADIVTRPRTGGAQLLHVYRSMAWGDRDGQWRPDAVREGNQSTHKWQPLVPKPESCSIFEDSTTVFSGLVDPLGDMVSATGGYAWQLWRPYECCRDRGKLLSHW